MLTLVNIYGYFLNADVDVFGSARDSVCMWKVD